MSGIEKYVKSLNRSRSDSVRPKKDRSVSKDSNRSVRKKGFKQVQESTPGKHPSLFSQTELDQLMETLAILTKKGGQSCKIDDVPDDKKDRRDSGDRYRGRRNHVIYPRSNMRNWAYAWMGSSPLLRWSTKLVSKTRISVIRRLKCALGILLKTVGLYRIQNGCDCTKQRPEESTSILHRPACHISDSLLGVDLSVSILTTNQASTNHWVKRWDNITFVEYTSVCGVCKTLRLYVSVLAQSAGLIGSERS